MSDPSASPHGPGRAAFFSILPSIILPVFLAIADQAMVATALPAIAGSLGGVERVSWIVIAYLVTITVAAPVYGQLSDLFGRRRLMLAALAVTIIASIACALATSIEMLTVFRAVQGIGGGGLMTLSHAIVGDAVPPRERARYHGYLAAIAVTSNCFGPVAGGFLTQYLGWQSVFLVNLPLGLVAILLSLRLPTSPRPGQAFHFDLPGLALFALFVSSTILMLQQVQNLTAALAPLALLLLAVAIMAIALFLWWENRTPTPLIPLSLFRNPSIWRSDAIAACHGAALVSLVTYTPIHLHVFYGASPGRIGVLLLPMTTCIGLSSIITGRLVSRTRYTALFPSWGLVGGTLALGGLAALCQRLTEIQLSIGLGIVALFLGTTMGVVQMTVQIAAGPKRLGSAVATVQFCRALGAALGTAIVGTVLFIVMRAADLDAGSFLRTALLNESGGQVASVGAEALRSGVADAFQAGYFTIACFTMVSAALAWTLPLRRV